MERNELKSILEALLFASADPLSPAELKKFLKIKNNEQSEVPLQTGEATGEVSVTGDFNVVTGVEIAPVETPLTDDNPLSQLLKRQSELDDEISAGEIRQVLDELKVEYMNRPQGGFELVEVARGYQFRSKVQFANYIRNMFKNPKPRFSAPSLETLSIVAYQQPVLKSRVDEIRGVESGSVLKTLLDRDLVRLVGRSEDPGKPVLYGTSRRFLEVFGLTTLGELPTLKDLAALETVQMVSEEVDGLTGNEGMEIFESSGLPEKNEVTTLTEEDADSLIAELDSSMENLKETEKMVFEPAHPAPTPTEPIS